MKFLKQVKLILANLPQIREALEKGSMVVFSQNRIRIRALPLFA
jgi:predicted nuclease of predicted toxin-antitoxin system